ncbi:MAG: SRPBCC family protein [Chitinophagales bacterium]|nr:SRPBCC family protein [Chitinophagales bacterium]
MYILKTDQFLPVSIDEVWDFISSPHNLSKITPDYMEFQITSGFEDQRMYEGMIITYKVKPILGIPLNWVTEITHVEDRKYFVDEQRFGPYKFWHHKHFLKEVDGGVLMSDQVHYDLPLVFFSSLVNNIMVKNQLIQIFTYRYNLLEKLFGKDKDAQSEKINIIRI